MSLQGPMIVVADSPATDLVDALSRRRRLPDRRNQMGRRADRLRRGQAGRRGDRRAGAPPSEAAARMLCLQIATANGTIVPVIARVHGDQEAAIPIALPADAALPVERLIARLQSAMRVRALHATVLRRIEIFASHDGRLPPLPVGDALDDATVLIAGRGPLYPKLSVAMGERVKMLGALSVETAAKHLNARDIDGIVVGDGFSPRMVEAFLTVLAQDTRFRDMPVAVIGEAPPEFAEVLPNIDHVDGDPARMVARMVPLVRMHAFEARLKRMLKTLDTNGMFDPETGLLTRDTFGRRTRQGDRAEAERPQHGAVARAVFLRRPARPARQHRRRPAGDAADPQYRFRLPRRGRLAADRLHADRSAQRPCGGAPHRRRAQEHHADAAARRATRSPPM